MISNKIHVITIYFVALLMYFSKINCHFTKLRYRILYRVRCSVIFPASLSTNLWHTESPETLPSHFTKFCAQSVPQTYIFPFLRNLCHKMSCHVPISLLLNCVSY